MTVGGEVGVGGGACITVEVEGCRLNVSTDGQRHNACRPGAFLRKSVLIGRGAVFELRFRRRCSGQRGHNGEHEKKREEDGLTHGGHPGYLKDGSHRI